MSPERDSRPAGETVPAAVFVTRDQSHLRTRRELAALRDRVAQMEQAARLADVPHHRIRDD
jgi:hypothetical protein